MSNIYVRPEKIVKKAILAILDESGPGTYTMTFMADFGFNKKNPGDFYYNLKEYSVTAKCIATGYEKSSYTRKTPTTTYSIIVEENGSSPSSSPKMASKRSRT